MKTRKLIITNGAFHFGTFDRSHWTFWLLWWSPKMTKRKLKCVHPSINITYIWVLTKTCSNIQFLYFSFSETKSFFCFDMIHLSKTNTTRSHRVIHPINILRILITDSWSTIDLLRSKPRQLASHFAVDGYVNKI